MGTPSRIPSQNTLRLNWSALPVWTSCGSKSLCFDSIVDTSPFLFCKQRILLYSPAGGEGRGLGLFLCKILRLSQFSKKCLSKRHICDMQFADVAWALKMQTAIKGLPFALIQEILWTLQSIWPYQKKKHPGRFRFYGILRGDGAIGDYSSSVSSISY